VAQDIPLEGSEKLAFTPTCLADFGERPPVFTLRTWTTREKREERKLQVRLGMRVWGKDAMRAEIRNGLKNLWTPDQAEAHLPLIDAYWEAQDNFDLQSADDPELVWEYDQDLENKIIEVLDRIGKVWPPLLEMQADNADFGAMISLVWLAIGVESWTGLETPVERAAGYLTIDCVERMVAELDRMGTKAKGQPVVELVSAVVKRKRLEDDDAGNSASPSPSETTQAASNPTSTSEQDGKSPASASSSTTPESA